MQIFGPTHIHGPQSISAPHNARPDAPPRSSGKTQGADSLDISFEADFASRIREVPEIRAERVAALRSAIADGSYETEERLSGAVDRLLDEIG